MKNIPYPSLLRRIIRENDGTAAIETGLVAMTLVTMFMNAVEISRYYYQKMELENATQMAAYAAYKQCDLQSEIPMTVGTNCSGYSNKITAALQSTSLGNRVTTPTGGIAEHYYCLSTTGTLVIAGPVTSTKPSDCLAAGGRSTDIPKSYIKITAQYTYSPMFTGITVGSYMPATVQSSTMMRLE